MNKRITNLFGEEEIKPERIKALAKPRALKEETGGKKEKKDPVSVLAGWAPEKQYYTISEVAELFGLRVSAIRYWADEFDLNVRLTQKGDRLFSGKNIQRLRLIYHLVKEQKLTLAGAKEKLKKKSGKAEQASVQKLDLEQALLQLRNKLVEIRKGWRENNTVLN